LLHRFSPPLVICPRLYHDPEWVQNQAPRPSALHEHGLFIDGDFYTPCSIGQRTCKEATACGIISVGKHAGVGFDRSGKDVD
jgi:hypothetical protein